MTWNLERAIFGTLEAAPGETATAEHIAETLQWPLGSVKRKLQELVRGQYVTKEENRYTLSHQLD